MKKKRKPQIRPFRVHKMSAALSAVHPILECSLFKDNRQNWTLDWEKVTCKRCLKYKEVLQ